VAESGVDLGKISAVFYGNDWHAVTVGSCRIERLVLPVVDELGNSSDYDAGEWLVFRSADGSHLNRLAFDAVSAFAERVS
jgi:hypothetical protein